MRSFKQLFSSPALIVSSKIISCFLKSNQMQLESYLLPQDWIFTTLRGLTQFHGFKKKTVYKKGHSDGLLLLEQLLSVKKSFKEIV